MRQKNLPSSTTTNLRRCVLHEKKKQIKTFERARVCFPVRDFPQNFCLPIMGVATSPPSSQYACLPATPMYEPPSLSYFWMRKQMIDEI